jgi:hypothetical protein
MFVIKFRVKLNRVSFILVEMNFKWWTYVVFKDVACNPFL